MQSLAAHTYLRDTYVSLRNAGFSEDEATTVITSIVHTLNAVETALPIAVR